MCGILKVLCGKGVINMLSEDTMNITGSVLLGLKTLALESALARSRMSTVIGGVPVFIAKAILPLNTQAYCLVRNKTGDEDIEQSSDGLFYTTPERTICDMINYDRREDLIIEALDDYLSEPERFKGKEYLLEIAEKYNVKEKVLYYIDEIDEYFNY